MCIRDRTNVSVESSSSNFSRVTNGVEVGDSVVTDPNGEMQDGQEVLIK